MSWRLVTYLPSRPVAGLFISPKVMLEGRLVDVEAGQRTRIGGVGQGVPDRHVGQAGHRYDVAGRRLGDLDSLDPVGRLEARHGPAQGGRPARLDRAVGRILVLADDGDPLAEPDRAVPDPADGHPADVLVGRQVRDEELEGVPGLEGRRRGQLDQEVEERPQVGPGHGQVAGRGAQPGVR